jgi:radical SAM superfamily enzyme YgiQ (UPF0313 family)
MRAAFAYAEVQDMARFGAQRREFPPFGVLYLAAILLRAGHDVEIVPISDPAERHDFRAFDFVGWSIASSATFNLLHQAHTQSTYAPRTRVAVGGVHCNLYPEQTLREFPARLAGIGDCDGTIEAIAAATEVSDLAGLDGIAFLDDEDRFVPGECGDYVNLDDLPLPARHLLPSDRVLMDDRLAGTDLPMAHIMLSRGCPFACRFCAARSSSLRYRTGRSAREEVVSLMRDYGIQGFAVVDDNFVANTTKAIDVARELQPLGVRWSALARVDRVRPQLLRELARSGCMELKYGIESGSQRMLDAMGKGTTTTQIRAALKATKDAGIGVKVFLVHGFPGEDLSTTGETIALLHDCSRLIDRVSLFRFVPLPGAEVYERWADYGLHGTHHQPDWDGDWSKFHIHHNERHWWGSEAQFEEMTRAYEQLQDVTQEHWPD